jgi:hypothetical protein
MLLKSDQEFLLQVHRLVRGTGLGFTSRIDAAALATDGNAIIDRLLGDRYLFETHAMVMLTADGVEAAIGLNRL